MTQPIDWERDNTDVIEKAKALGYAAYVIDTRRGKSIHAIFDPNDRIVSGTEGYSAAIAWEKFGLRYQPGRGMEL